MALTKTLTFAALHFSVAFGVAYALTGSAAVGGLVALVEPLVNTFAFYLHERVWATIVQAPRKELLSNPA
ncbi:MAG: DUF2061 domain-containing protein [Rhodospirillales bacterium]|nr:DUF2061 domain-containing protein [Rhodospirillales bacterium]